MSPYFKYLIILPFIFITANFVYQKSGFYKNDIKKCDGELLYLVDSLSAKNIILYFGESSNFTTAPSDSSSKSISGILDNLLENNSVAAVNKSASHAGTYKQLIYRLKSKKTDTIILTMNLRSFGINWIESKLETNLSKTNIIYSTYPPIIKKFMLAFKAYDNKELFQRERIIKTHYKNDILFTEEGKFPTVKKWDAFMFDKGHLLENGERDAPKCELACHYIKNFGFIINSENPRVKDFDEIIDFCKMNNITVILNLLPENHEMAQELCGIDLVKLMELNAKFLKNRYSSQCIFIDNMKLLSDSIFIDRSWPTEHYFYEGRRSVANSIANVLKNKHHIN